MFLDLPGMASRACFDEGGFRAFFCLACRNGEFHIEMLRYAKLAADEKNIGHSASMTSGLPGVRTAASIGSTT